MAARRQTLHGLSRGEPMRPLYGYLCVCRRWHVTSKPEWDGIENVLLWSVPADLQAWALTGERP